MKRILVIGAAAVLVFSTAPSFAKRIYHENEYQLAWCAEHSGVIEYVLEDRSRVDCLTREYAVEVDFAGKWAEAVGQALYYGLRTDRNPGIVLIMEEDSDRRFLKRLREVSNRLGIRVWTITPLELRKRPDKE